MPITKHPKRFVSFIRKTSVFSSGILIFFKKYSLSKDFIYIYNGSEGKESAYNTGDLGLIPGSGRSPGEGNGNLLQ